MGYFISYSAPSRDKLLYRVLLITVMLWLFTLGYIWKERILLFLLFPGKEELGMEILREGFAQNHNSNGFFQAAMAILQRCRNG